MSRSLLAKHKLPAFKEWLDTEFINHRPGRGDYDVLQVLLPSGQWQCLFDRHDSPEHFTVAKPLEPTVRRFIAESRPDRLQHGSEKK